MGCGYDDTNKTTTKKQTNNAIGTKYLKLPRNRSDANEILEIDCRLQMLIPKPTRQIPLPQ